MAPSQISDLHNGKDHLKFRIGYQLLDMTFMVSLAPLIFSEYCPFSVFFPEDGAITKL